MSTNKFLVSCLTALVTMSTPVSVFATDTNNNNSTDPNQVYEAELTRDAGLINNHYLSVSYNSTTIYINTLTTSYSTMAEIGEIDIEVLQSANGVNGWSTYTTISNKTNHNSSSHILTNYAISITTGYYYKIKLKHYAKETGWFFPDSESISATSGIMRIV